MNDPRDYKLDLTSADQPNGKDESAAPANPFLSVMFACCKVYQRIYRDADGKHYQGRCPRCGLSVKFVVGDGGTDSRSFVVS